MYFSKCKNAECPKLQSSTIKFLKLSSLYDMPIVNRMIQYFPILNLFKVRAFCIEIFLYGLENLQ